MKLSIAYLTICIMYASSAYGALYYVTENANGNGNGTSYANSMSVTTHNSSTFSPGDIIVLCGGEITTQVIVPSSGTLGNPITYTNSETNPSILRAYSSSGAIRISEKKHVVVDGLDIRHGRIGIAAGKVEYLTIKRCHIYDMDSKGMLISVSGGDSKNRYVIIGGAPGDGNEVYNVGLDTGGGDYAFSKTEDLIISYNKGIGDPNGKGTDGVVMTDCDRVLIEYNLFKDHSAPYPIGEDGIDIKGTDDVIIRYNITYNNRMGGIKINFFEPGSRYCNRVAVYNNLSYGNSYNFNASGNDEGENHSNIYVWGNLFHSPRTGHNIWTSAKGENYHFYNNTIVGTVSDRAGLYISGGKGYFIKNNIFLGDENNRMIWSNVSPEVATISNNLYFRVGHTPQIRWDGTWTTATTVDTKGKNTDPKFVNLANHNFRLQGDSPAITSGEPISKNPPSITIFGKTHNFYYDEVLCPSTDWSVFPPKVNKIKINTSENGLPIGAYGIKSILPQPQNLVILQ